MVGPKTAWLPVSLNPQRAGVRFRCLTPLRQLQQWGLPIELYADDKPGYDLIIAQDKAFFASHAEVEDAFCDARVDGILRRVRAGSRLVIDLCDNPFFYDKPTPKFIKGSKRLTDLLEHTNEIVCGTEYLADQIRTHLTRATPISIIEDPVESAPFTLPSDDSLWRWVHPARLRAWADYVHFRRKIRRQRSNHRTLLVWYGIHGATYAMGGMESLARVDALLHRINESYPLALSIISNHQQKYADLVAEWNFPTQYLDWNRLTFHRALRHHEIAIFPTVSNPFTLSKGNNRAALALNQGLAVVADDIPSYRALQSCMSVGDFENGLLRYLSDPACRAEEVSRGKLIVDEKYSIVTIARQWLDLIQRNTPQ